MKIIDIHMHAFKYKPLPHTGSEDSFMIPREVIGLFDEMGIKKGVLLPIISPEYMNSVQGNEEVLSIVSENPDRFSWFCNVDPRNGNNSSSSDLLKNILAYKRMGARGIGEITANLPFDDPLVYNLFNAAQQADMPVLFHIAVKKYNGYGLIDDLGLPKLEKALQSFPSLKFIGHSQPFWAEIDGALSDENRNSYPKGKPVRGTVSRLLKDYPNMYGDLSAGSGFNAISRDGQFGYEFLEEFQDKLFFGTDICSFNERNGLLDYMRNAVNKGKISQGAFDKICFENAENILKI